MRPTLFIGLVLCNAMLAPGVGLAQAAPPVAATADPEINRPYVNPDVEYWRRVFESEQREIYRHRHDILAALNLRPGMRVADVGAGTGFFSLMFARAVGDGGRVYAVDISPEFISAIQDRAAAEGLGNLTGVVNSQASVPLPPDSVDLVFISDTYHHFEDPRAMLDGIRAALVPGGEVVVVDFRRVEGQSGPWVMGHVRAGAEVVISELEAEGFRFEERLDFMRSQYFLRFRKPPSTQPHDATPPGG
jgi:SAM-dependent methyltransferase